MKEKDCESCAIGDLPTQPRCLSCLQVEMVNGNFVIVGHKNWLDPKDAG